jgi:fibronectin-binding autotransporter adhesin
LQLVFAGNLRLTNIMDGDFLVNWLQFTNGAGAFNLTGSNLLTLRGGLTNNSTNRQTISITRLVVQSNQTWSAAAGSVTVSSAITNNATVLTVNATSNKLFTLSGAISGTGGLTKTGGGTNLLTGTLENTYSGTTTVSQGSLVLAKPTGINAIAGNVVIGTTGGTPNSDLLISQAANQIADSSAIAINGSGSWVLNGFSETVGSLTVSRGSVLTGGGNLNSGALAMTGGLINSGAGVYTLGGDVIINGFSNAATISGNLNLGASRSFSVVDGSAPVDLLIDAMISGAGFQLTKTGNGKMVLTGANTYTGGTLVNAGTLQVNNLTGSGTGTGLVLVRTNGTLAGQGTVAGPVTVTGTISPGSAVGTLTTGNQLWDGGGGLHWEVSDASGVVGSDPGWDLLTINGGLSIAASPADKFVIGLNTLTPGGVAGNATNFNSAFAYDWRIVTASGGITGFDTNSFLLNTSGFVNDTGVGSFYLTLENFGQDLYLHFTPVPEPGPVALLALGGVALLLWHFRRQPLA